MDIFVSGTANTPSLLFNAAKKEWLIYGRAYHKEPAVSFAPVLNWLTSLEDKSVAPYTFQVRLDFFDTASYKILHDILLGLKQRLANYGLTPSVQWYYEDGDDDMKDSGETFMTAIKLDFELICYPERL
jgi:hypothetical protein